MKKLNYIFFIFFFFLVWTSNASNEDVIKNTVDQINYLIERNNNDAVTKKWYLVFLGDTKEDLKYYLNESKIKGQFSNNYLESLNNKLTSINQNKSLKTSIYTVITDGYDISLSFFKNDLNLKNDKGVNDYLESLLINNTNADSIKKISEDQEFWKAGREQNSKNAYKKANNLLSKIFKDSKLYGNENTHNVLISQYFFNVLNLKDINKEKASIWAGLFYTKKLLPYTNFNKEGLKKKYLASTYKLGNTPAEIALGKYIDGWENYLASPEETEIEFDYTDNYNLKLFDIPNDKYNEVAPNDIAAPKVYDFCGALTPENYKKINEQFAKNYVIGDFKMYIFYTDSNTNQSILDNINKLKKDKDIVLLWVHKKSDEELQFTTVAPEEYDKINNDLLAWKELSPMQKIWSNAKYKFKNDATAVGIGLGEAFSGLATVLSEAIRQAKTPESFYNKCHKDFIFKGHEDLVDMLWVDAYTVTSVFDDGKTTGFINEFYKAYEISNDCAFDFNKGSDRAFVSFAFVQGLWNGAVDVVADLGESFEILNYILNPEKHSEISNFLEKMEQEEGSWGKLFDVTKTSLSDAHSLSNIYKLSHQVGYDTTFILSFAIAFTKVGNLAKVSYLLEALDITTYLFKLIGKGFKLVKYTTKAGKKVLNIVSDVTGKVIYKLETVGNKLLLKLNDVKIGYLTKTGDIISEFSDEIIGFLYDGKIFLNNVLFPNSLDGLEFAYDVVTNGNFYQLANDATLDKIKSSVSNFSKKLDDKIYAYTKKNAGIVYATTKKANLEDLKGKLANINSLSKKAQEKIAKKAQDLNLSTDKVDELIKGLKNNKKFRDKIVGNVEAIKAWDILNSAGRNDLKIEPEILEAILKASKNTKIGYVKDDFVKLFKRQASEGRPGVSYIDELGNTNIIAHATLGAKEFLEAMEDVANSTIIGKDNFLKSLCCSGSNKHYIGLEFQLRYVKNNLSDIAELEQDLVGRIIDVVAKSPPRKRELKSWRQFLSENQWSNTIKQFTRDLKDIDTLDDLLWVFDKKGNFTNDAPGRAYLKDNFMKMLKSDEGRKALEELDKTKLGQLLNYNNIKIQTSTKAQLVEDLIFNLDIPSNFNSIFR